MMNEIFLFLKIAVAALLIYRITFLLGEILFPRFAEMCDLLTGRLKIYPTLAVGISVVTYSAFCLSMVGVLAGLSLKLCANFV